MKAYIVTKKDGSEVTVKADIARVTAGDLRFFTGQQPNLLEVARFAAKEWSNYREAPESETKTARPNA